MAINLRRKKNEIFFTSVSGKFGLITSKEKKWMN